MILSTHMATFQRLDGYVRWMLIVLIGLIPFVFIPEGIDLSIWFIRAENGVRCTVESAADVWTEPQAMAFLALVYLYVTFP